jgi:hypothetical protein
MNTLTLSPAHYREAKPRTTWNSLKLFALFIFWNYGLFVLFFLGFCVACYLYFDAVCLYLLPPEACDTVKDTPTAGKVVFVVIAGRRVAVRMNREVKRLKAKYVKGE